MIIQKDEPRKLAVIYARTSSDANDDDKDIDRYASGAPNHSTATQDADLERNSHDHWKFKN